MTDTSLTVVLDGDVSLNLFAESMQRFHRLIEALTREVSGQANIVWVVDDLAAGGALTTIRGVSDEPVDVERVVRAYATVGRSLERREVIPFSPLVANAARELTSVINGQITSVRFETADGSSTITTGTADQSPTYLTAFGAIEGRIEPPQSRNQQHFTLYDSNGGIAVYCVLGPGHAGLARDAWDRRALVEGWIKRESASGQPVEINPVETITVLPDVIPGSYRRARGIAPARPDQESPEDTIRRLRDA